MQGQAEAFFQTGNDLVMDMREYEKSDNDRSESWYQTGRYAGFVVGVHDALQGILFQAPPNVRVKQIFAIVANYLKNHPERWNESGLVLVADALKEAFPLKK